MGVINPARSKTKMYESTNTAKVRKYIYFELFELVYFKVALHNLCIIFPMLNTMTLGKNELR